MTLYDLYPFTAQTAIRLTLMLTTTAIAVSCLEWLYKYKIYAPGCVGGWDELITIFFFGFGLDITTDSVLQLKDKKN